MIKKSESKTALKNNKNVIQKISNNLFNKKADKLFASFKGSLDKNTNNKKLYTSVRKYKI